MNHTSRFRIALSLLVACLVVFLTAGCGSGGGERPLDTPRPVDFVVRVTGGPDTAPIVERFVVRLVTQQQISTARAILAGQRSQQIVFGDVAGGNAGYNRDPAAGRTYDWHMVPETIQFVDVTAEIFDGLPRDINDEWIRTVGAYGPWSSHLEREIIP